MGDPDRLLNVTSDADDLERELLASVRQVGPPDGAKDAGWQGIAAQLTAAVSIGAAAHTTMTAEASAASAGAAKAGIGAAASSGSSGLVSAALSNALVAKIAVALALGGSTVGAGTWYLQHRAQGGAPVAELGPPPAPVVTAAPKETIAPSPPTEVTVNAAPVPAETAAASPLPKHADNARPRDSLDAESALLTEARAQLRGGDARASMATLDRLRAQFPKGVLTQEREVLGIEVMAALGDAQGASRRAQAFSDAHPNSPHTVKLRRFIIDP